MALIVYYLFDRPAFSLFVIIVCTSVVTLGLIGLSVYSYKHSTTKPMKSINIILGVSVLLVGVSVTLVSLFGLKAVPTYLINQELSVMEVQTGEINQYYTNEQGHCRVELIDDPTMYRVADEECGEFEAAFNNETPVQYQVHNDHNMLVDYTKPLNKVIRFVDVGEVENEVGEQ